MSVKSTQFALLDYLKDKQRTRSEIKLKLGKAGESALDRCLKNGYSGRRDDINDGYTGKRYSRPVIAYYYFIKYPKLKKRTMESIKIERLVNALNEVTECLRREGVDRYSKEIAMSDKIISEITIMHLT